MFVFPFIFPSASLPTFFFFFLDFALLRCWHSHCLAGNSYQVFAMRPFLGGPMELKSYLMAKSVSDKRSLQDMLDLMSSRDRQVQTPGTSDIRFEFFFFVGFDFGFGDGFACVCLCVCFGFGFRRRILCVGIGSCLTYNSFSPGRLFRR
jgi:hypothetical protein